MRMPLKRKYLVAKPKGCASKSGNSLPKKHSIQWHLEQSAKRLGKR